MDGLGRGAVNELGPLWFFKLQLGCLALLLVGIGAAASWTLR